MAGKMFPGLDKVTSADRLGAELADQQLDLIFGLRAIRVDRGLTIAEVAKAMGIDPAQVSRFESGSTNPTMSTIRRYATAIGALFQVTTCAWSDEHTRRVQAAANRIRFATATGEPAGRWSAVAPRAGTSLAGHNG